MSTKNKITPVQILLINIFKIWTKLLSLGYYVWK